jgi:hypothetical protein
MPIKQAFILDACGKHFWEGQPCENFDNEKNTSNLTKMGFWKASSKFLQLNVNFKGKWLLQSHSKNCRRNWCRSNWSRSAAFTSTLLEWLEFQTCSFYFWNFKVGVIFNKDVFSDLSGENFFWKFFKIRFCSSTLCWAKFLSCKLPIKKGFQISLKVYSGGHVFYLPLAHPCLPISTKACLLARTLVFLPSPLALSQRQTEGPALQKCLCFNDLV